MATITASNIINKAGLLLQDPSFARWTRNELLGWVNDGQRQIILQVPNATNKLAVVPLVLGTKQAIPTDGWALLELIRFCQNSDGTGPGRAPRITSRELIDSYNPDWHSDEPALMPDSYIFDQQDQTAYYVYPPSTGKGYMFLNYSPTPVDLASETELVYIPDIYQTALLDYVMYRACSKDAEYAPGLQLATGYYTTFIQTLASKRSAEAGNTPNVQFNNFDPSVPGTNL